MSNQQARIFITGAGFIASRLALRLAENSQYAVCCFTRSENSYVNQLRHAGVHCVIAPLEDQATLLGTLTSFKPTIVVHSAAVTGNQDQAMTVRATESLLQALSSFCEATAAPIRLYHLSSLSVYGQPQHPRGLVSEADIPAPETPYGKAKWQAECLINNFADQHKQQLQVCHARITNIAGADKFMHRVIGAAKQPNPTSKPFIHTGYNTQDGSMVRDYIHPDDLTGALAVLVGSDHVVDRVYNIGTEQPVSFLVLLKQLQALLRLDGQELIEYRHTAGGDFPTVLPTCQRFLAQFHWRPAHTTPQALAQAAYACYEQ